MDNTKKLSRSFLFVPGDRPDLFPKAHKSSASEIILDLEDAVAHPDKALARDSVARSLPHSRQILIRINSKDTSWFSEDLDICRLPGIGGIIVPKAESADDIEYVTDYTEHRIPIFPLIETARGFINMQLIAETPLVKQLIFGSIDFQLDLSMTAEEDELGYFRSQMALISRASNILPPIDAVTTSINDEALLKADTYRAKRLGFSGKLCIHPAQVNTVNTCFAPSAEEIAWAKRIIEATAQSKGSATKVDGKMVDRPMITHAELILAYDLQLRNHS